MDINVRTTNPVRDRGGCVVVGVFRGRRLSPSAQALDAACGRALSRLLRRGDLSGRIGHNLLLPSLPGVRAERVLVVGCGEERELDDGRYRKAVAQAAEALAATGARDALVYLAELKVGERDTYWRCRALVESWRDALYRFERLKSKPEQPAPALKRLTVNVAGRGERATAERAASHATAISDATDLARDLGNLPGNVCTPSYLAEEARKIARRHRSVQVKVLGEAQMKRLGMGNLLSVTRGSREPARFVILEYRGVRSERKPVVLVGKGVTFDSGGISIKPSAAMDEMKFDMCGAASVLASVQAAAALRLKLNLVGLVPATENLPDGNASKPGDVVTSLSGQTVEILNTDAEGRLILSDALTYAERYKPEVVLDMATLTGACVVALGHHASGLFSEDDALAEALLAAGAYSGDRAWRLPLWDDYQEALKSNFADMANVGGRDAGAVTAACFLARYAKAYRWAHLDIAGSAWTSGNKKGATGRPVKLLLQYLLDRGR